MTNTSCSGWGWRPLLTHRARGSLVLARLAPCGRRRSLSEAACQILRGQGAGRPDALVFPATRGDGIMGGFPWLFGRIVQAAGLPSDISPHVLRHSFASLASDLGYSEPTIATMIGHQGRSMTSRYAHAADAVLLAAADAVAERITELMK